MNRSRAALGAHVSIAGGLSTAIERAEELACETAQIFVKNNNRWLGRPLLDAEVEEFRAAHEASSIGPIVAHATYLINLAAQDPKTLERSLATLSDEVERCTRLGLDGLVLHPGAHVGAGEEKGLEQIARSLDYALSRAPGSTPVLLEITAGQGTVLGSRLDQLATIIESCCERERLGVCLDTCHAFAAGYPLHQDTGYEAFFAEVEATIGLASIRCFHLNDSIGALGSHRDRHANLGRGEIGLELFRKLVGDPRLRHIPMILETPRGDDGEGHRRDLELLRDAGDQAQRRSPPS